MDLKNKIEKYIKELEIEVESITKQYTKNILNNEDLVLIYIDNTRIMLYKKVISDLKYRLNNIE